MKIRYFAWLREHLKRSEDEVAPPDTVRTIGELVDWRRSVDDAFRQAVPAASVLRFAIDSRLARPETPFGTAQVVAIFPPMTGG